MLLTLPPNLRAVPDLSIGIWWWANPELFISGFEILWIFGSGFGNPEQPERLSSLSSTTAGMQYRSFGIQISHSDNCTEGLNY
jgi:hypothetical protein